ncbi:glycosyltransferase family 1 protein [Altererythrobacter sp. CC-YST694]|uniref:glycosyltransferase family 4 protein n=1 Tax=Altererythrobacter sp. CC-YST694 TaxID=2755038 RepID=UPI001D01BBF5|nr:glycosyltransferase family 1 protein [Altererythrobacter sp. CC-YST694]MCB5426330.1 glycosyltransferase family 1 protein [Altererythrobacter sp. CC-YST694]
MDTSQLRIALFSGNYNMVRDGANQALNRLVGYLLRQGAAVRIYSPVVDKPDFPPTGDLVGVNSFAIPGRSEYRVAVGLSRQNREDLARFAPNVVHISAPDFACRQAAKWARDRAIPVLASVHTRFETYPRYYKLGFLEPTVENWLRKLYRRCDALVAPSQSMVDVLHEQGMNPDIGIWSRGVDRTIFNPAARSLEWRRSLGIADSDVAVGFLGRLVMEKGLDVFADTIGELERRGVKHKVLVVGEGPARAWFAEKVPDACFAGFQAGADLGRAVASMDMLFNPSITETFGNVTLEAMACRLPVVAARATGSDVLVADGVSGRLVTPGDISGFADAVQAYAQNPALNAEHGAAGEARSLQFDWDRINQAVADTYIRLIGQRAAGK